MYLVIVSMLLGAVSAFFLMLIVISAIQVKNNEVLPWDRTDWLAVGTLYAAWVLIALCWPASPLILLAWGVWRVSGH